MNKETYKKIEDYMKEMMKDSAHDNLHIYRVLYQALKISEGLEVDRDVLIASALLHDIGRGLQFANPKLCHAEEGGKLAKEFLLKIGWSEEKAQHVKNAITTHRFRGNNVPQTIEAEILFDADKLDVTGALGIARSLLYEGEMGEPLYLVDENKKVINNENAPESFFTEYHYKLIKLYDGFYTKRASDIAQKRKRIMVDYYNALLEEVKIDDLDCLLKLK